MTKKSDIIITHINEGSLEINKNIEYSTYNNYSLEMQVKELQLELNALRGSIHDFKNSLTKVGLKKEMIDLIIEEGFPPDDIAIIDNPNFNEDFLDSVLNPENYLVIKYDLNKMIDYLKFKNEK